MSDQENQVRSVEWAGSLVWAQANPKRQYLTSWVENETLKSTISTEWTFKNKGQFYFLKLVHLQLFIFSTMKKIQHTADCLVIQTVYFGQIFTTEVRSYIKLLKNKNKYRNIKM